MKLFYIGVVATGIFIILKIFITWMSSELKPKRPQKKTEYHYKKKDFLIFRNEHEFFDLLVSIVGNKYYVFPQMHLETFLNHKIKGQNWRGAFRHIDEKSVDYLICDKNYIKPLLAIELDGSSHKQEKRVERDIEVERILKEANLPLLRIENSKRHDKEEIRNNILSILES